MSNPWKIDDSDNEDEIKKQLNQRRLLSFRTQNSTLGTMNQPKIVDWHPVEDENTPKQRFRRKKTTPSFEHSPSDHRPVFSGQLRLRSALSSNSILEKNNKSVKTETSILSEFNPIALIQENLKAFIYTCIPFDYPSYIHCCLRRDTMGIHRGLYPTFYLQVERPDDGKKFLVLAARKIAKVNLQAEYIITTSVETLSEKTGGDGYVGKLRGHNVKGTEYTLYDNGISPNRYRTKDSQIRNGLRRELAAIIYNTNILGFQGPRQINFVIPSDATDIQPLKGENTILDCWRERRFTELIQLRNRMPRFNEETKIHTLEFLGFNDVQPSVKNFQVVLDKKNHEEDIIMQFGRINDDTFILDYRYPLSAIQAFGIALSSFDSRLARE